MCFLTSFLFLGPSLKTNKSLILFFLIIFKIFNVDSGLKNVIKSTGVFIVVVNFINKYNYYLELLYFMYIEFITITLKL